MSAPARPAARPPRPTAPAGLAQSNAVRTAWLIALAVLLMLAILLSIAIGSKSLPMPTIVDAFVAGDGSNAHQIVTRMRLPRTVLGCLVGAALGVSGALIQALTRNPLADPGILGVNAGAGFLVVIAVGFFGVATIDGYLWFALAGAFLTTVIVYLIGSAGRGPSPVSLTLAGVAIGAVLGAVGTGLTLLNPTAFDQMRNWNAGSLEARGPDIVWASLPFFLVGGLLAFLAARPLNAVALGDDLAASLGVHVVRTRILVIVAVTLLSGAATAVAGPIGFVGLVIPHAVRWIVGPDQRWIIAYSVVAGPVLVLLADVLGRLVVRPTELPVGIVTAFIGAPVLILLARRAKVSRP